MRTLLPTSTLLALTLLGTACDSPHDGTLKGLLTGTFAGTTVNDDYTLPLKNNAQYLRHGEPKLDPRFGNLTPFSTQQKVNVTPVGGYSIFMTVDDLWRLPVVGKNAAMAKFEYFQQGAWVTITTAPIDVTSVKATGRGVDPIEISMAFDVDLKRPSTPAADGHLKGELTLWGSCVNDNSAFYCTEVGGLKAVVGSTPMKTFLPGDTTLVLPRAFPGQPALPAGCPAEIAALHGIAEGATGTFKEGSFTVGTTPPIPCDNIFCHEEKKGVQADGCTWTVNTFIDINPKWFYAAYGKNVSFAYVNAVADPGCAREVTFCQVL